MATLKSLQEQIDELKEQNKLILDALIKLDESDKIDLKLKPVESIIEEEIITPAIDIIKEEKPVIKPKAKKTDSSLEEDIGIKWFGRIGITALVIGVGFFIKFAVDNGLISYLARIIMGVVFGVGLVVAGEYASKKEQYRKWGKTLVGGGLAIVYFVVYAAYHLASYREAIGISQGLDIVLLSIVAMFTVFFSLKDDSQIIAGEAFLLGFVTSLIGSDFQVLTLVYNLILAIVLIVVVAYKKWPLIGVGGLVGTYFTYFIWFSGNSDRFGLAMSFLLIYFLAYTAQVILLSNEKKQDEKLDRNNIGMTLLNATLFFSLGLYLIRKHFVDYDSLFSILLAFYYFGLSYFSFVTNRIKIGVTSFYLGILFLTVSIPLYLHREWITIAWSLLTLVLIICWSKYKSKMLLYSSHFVGLATIFKVLVYDSSRLQALDFRHFLNSTRLFTFLFVVICFYASYFIFHRTKNKLLNDETDSTPFLYSAAGTGLLVLILAIELIDYSQLITVAWSLLSLVLIYVAFNSRFKEFKYQGIGLSSLIGAKIFWIDTWLKAFSMSDILTSYRAIAFISGIILFYWASFYFNYIKERLEQRDTGLSSIYSWVASGLFALLILLEIKDYWISIGWALLGLLIMAIGFYQRRKEFRYQGILLFGITIFKVFLYDTKELSTIYRTISFMVLGSILLATSFIYAKYKDKLKEIL